MAFTFNGIKYMSLEEAVQYLLEQSNTLKNEIDSLSNGALLKTGGTMTGNIILPNEAPTNPLQAVSKNYVDNMTSGGGEILIDFTSDTGGVGTGEADVTAKFISVFPTTTDVHEAIRNRKQITIIDGYNYSGGEQYYTKYYLVSAETNYEMLNVITFATIYYQGGIFYFKSFTVTFNETYVEPGAYAAQKSITSTHAVPV